MLVSISMCVFLMILKYRTLYSKSETSLIERNWSRTTAPRNATTESGCPRSWKIAGSGGLCKIHVLYPKTLVRPIGCWECSCPNKKITKNKQTSKINWLNRYFWNLLTHQHQFTIAGWIIDCLMNYELAVCDLIMS